MPALSNTFLFIEPQKHYLEYSAKVIHELIAQNRSAGQNIVELIGEDANPAKIKETLSSLNPIVVSGVGHGSYVAYTVECTTMFMQKGDSNVPLMAGRVVHLNSCQTGGQLGPALVENGATAYVGSRESFWFYVGDAPNSSRAVRSPFLAEWQFDVSLLKGKTVAQAHSDMMQKYEEELTYWIEGEGKNHPDAGEIARILNINKSINTYLYSSQGETIVVSPSGGSSGEFNVVGMVLGGVAAVAIGWWLLK